MREKNIKALLLRREYPVLKIMLNSMNNVDLASLLCLYPDRDQRTVRRHVYG